MRRACCAPVTIRETGVIEIFNRIAVVIVLRLLLCARSPNTVAVSLVLNIKHQAVFRIPLLGEAFGVNKLVGILVTAELVILDYTFLIIVLPRVLLVSHPSLIQPCIVNALNHQFAVVCELGFLCTFPGIACTNPLIYSSHHLPIGSIEAILFLERTNAAAVGVARINGLTDDVVLIIELECRNLYQNRIDVERKSGVQRALSSLREPRRALGFGYNRLNVPFGRSIGHEDSLSLNGYAIRLKYRIRNRYQRVRRNIRLRLRVYIHGHNACTRT